MESAVLYLLLPFAALLIMGIPVAVCMGFASFSFLLFSGTPLPALIVVTDMYDGVGQFALLAVPLFVLVGELLSRCQITEKLVEVAKHVAGWATGGLAHVNIVASMFFAGISGSVLADTASIGPLLIPAMVRERFSPAFSAAVTASSSVIGAIIPPSVLMIVLGGHLEISIGALFAAGIIPGILVGAFLMFTAFVISLRRGYGVVHPFQGFVPMAKASAKAFPALVIPLWILGGILSGVFTPTEAGAIAVLYTIVISAFYYRTLTLRVLYDSLVSGVRVTATVMFIVATAIVFSHLLAFNRVPQELLKVFLAHSIQDRLSGLQVSTFRTRFIMRSMRLRHISKRVGSEAFSSNRNGPSLGSRTTREFTRSMRNAWSSMYPLSS